MQSHPALPALPAHHSAFAEAGSKADRSQVHVLGVTGHTVPDLSVIFILTLEVLEPQKTKTLTLKKDGV